jgi:hypothetical protein
MVGVYLAKFTSLDKKHIIYRRLKRKLNQRIAPYSQFLHRCYSHPYCAVPGFSEVGYAELEAVLCVVVYLVLFHIQI